MATQQLARCRALTHGYGLCSALTGSRAPSVTAWRSAFATASSASSAQPSCGHHGGRRPDPLGPPSVRPPPGSRWKSTTAVPAAATSDADADSRGNEGSPTGVAKRRVDPLDLTFMNHEAAFKSKSTLEVLRALVVFQLCSIGPLVEHNEKLMKFGQKLIGKTLFGLLMKSTFYGQFVAGEDQERIKPTIHRMHTFGVKSILDYSVEEDLSEEQAQQKEMQDFPSSQGAVPEQESVQDPSDLNNTGSHEDRIRRYTAHKSPVLSRKYKLHGARTYFYENEAQCEKNMEIFLRSIEAVADSTSGTGFAAIKMTALGRPSLLLQLSEVIVRARRYYQDISGKDGFVIEGKVSKEAFEKRFKEKSSYERLDANEEVKDWLSKMTFDKKGLIHLFSWSGLIDSKLLLKDVFRVPNLKTGKIEPLITALTDEEEEQFRNMLNRVETVFQAARELDVRVMVDAEQTYFQPAIHRLSMEMMKKFNREKPIVFNTYQTYLKIAFHSLVLDLEQANRQDFHFGAKLVRGAYMEQERQRAVDLKYEDPVNPSFEATSEMYHRCLSECMRRMSELKQLGDGSEKKISIMVASHNADTVRFAIQQMKELDINPEDRLICFGQLLGMCDNLSFPLGQAGYSVYKYVPYGPVNEVLPYLSRRAHENKGMLTKLQTEKSLLRKELGRRLTSGQLFYRPKGEYVPVGFENVQMRQ